MDMEGFSLSDRRNRFQVNRVDSVATGHHTPSQIEGPTNPAATLVGYNDRRSIKSSMARGEPNEANRGRRVSMIDDVINANGESRRVSVSRSASPSNLTNNDDFHSNFNQNNTITNSSSYDTKYAKSFRHFTREALPRLDNYRNMMSIQAAYRPTLDELHDITLHQDKSLDGTPVTNPAAEGGGFVKFGWVKGVFVRCLLNIWGVMLFLRLSWVVGQAGIVEAFIIIFLATSVTLLTGISMSAISTNGQIKGAQAFLIIISMTVVTLISALSMAAVCTNGLVKGGGTYYMISRSLGPEFGASIGLIFALANAIAVAMYTVGFAESMVDLLKSLDTFVVEDPTNSIRIIGTVAIIAQTCIVVIGMEWEATAQVGLLFILLAAIFDFVLGSIIGPLSVDELSKGFLGFNGSLFVENLGQSYRYSEGVDQSFFSVFSIFFPAATGILAGANISGDLEDPQSAIPKGTLLAIFVTTISYLAFAAIAGACVLRDATGPMLGIENLTDAEAWNATLHTVGNCYTFNETTGVTEFTCTKFGLMNNFQVMELVSAWGPLIYAGCFAATLSSALASFVSAPKVFQALCNDKLYPNFINFFGKGYGKNNEPVRGYILTFIIALAFILIAQLNAIAPLISNFFLAAYALVNFSTFHASLAKPVGWRPTFRYYNMWLSLAGAILCVAVMFLISWVTALLTFAAIIFLYLVVIYRKPDVNWGSTTQAQTYKNALLSVQQLNNVDEHVKNFRPQILILSGLPFVRPSLVDFAYLITKQLSLMVCGQVIKSNLNNRTRTGLIQRAHKWFQTQKMKAFFCVVDDMEFEEGARALLQAYGVGKLKPNILLMGYKHDWMMCKRSDLVQYFNVIHKALDMHLSVAVLRVDGGLDFSKKITFGGNDEQHLSSSHNAVDARKSKNSSNDSIPRNPSDLSFSQTTSPSTPGEPEEKPTKEESKNSNRSSSPIGYKGVDGGEVSRDIMDDLMRFQRKYKHGTVDVWWLYDDGGLTLLLPYIITTRSSWSTCKLRVFTLANKKDEFDSEQRSMAELLSKFRIDYSDLRVIQDINTKPQAATVEFFEKHISSFRKEPQNDDEKDACVTDAEILSMRDKTNRHMRLRELLLHHSRNSSLVVMTLPMPRKGVVSAPLYHCWLELLTKDMPPFLLVRGNQTSVLTFYS